MATRFIVAHCASGSPMLLNVEQITTVIRYDDSNVYVSAAEGGEPYVVRAKFDEFVRLIADAGYSIIKSHD